jgi:hypothetical protein
LGQKVDEVGDEEQLERMKIRLAAAAQILRGQKSRPCEKQAAGAENLGIKVEELTQSMGKKVMERKIRCA